MDSKESRQKSDDFQWGKDPDAERLGLYSDSLRHGKTSGIGVTSVQGNEQKEEVKGQSDREKQQHHPEQHKQQHVHQQQQSDQQEEEQQFGVSEKIYSSGNKQSLLAKLEQAQQEIERLKQQQSMRSSKSQRSTRSSQDGQYQSLLAQMEQMRLENEQLKQQQSMRSSKSQRSTRSSQGGLQQSIMARQMEELRLENEQLKQQQSMRSSKSKRSIGSSQVSAAKTMDGLVPSSYQPPSKNPENMEHNSKNIPLYRQFYGVPIREIDYGSDDFWVEPSYNPYAVKRQSIHQFPVQPRHSEKTKKEEELCYLREKIRKFPCWENMWKNPMNGEQMELIADAINYNDIEIIEKISSIYRLNIKLASKQECASNTKHSQIFSRFMKAMEKLTKKILFVDIHNFTHEYKMEELSNIIEKCGGLMKVHYDDDEEDEVVQRMDQRLQDVFSKLPRNGYPLILTHHQYHVQFIKQLSPVMTSSYESMIFDYPDGINLKFIQLPSVSCDDDLLRKLANHINGETFYFYFFISDRNEITNFINLIKHIKREISWIDIYFPRNTTRSETKLFANAITEFNEKIWFIDIFNLTSNNIDVKDLLKIAPKVGGSLYSELCVYFTDNQSDDVKSALVKKFESLVPRPYIKLHFRDDKRTIYKPW